jgi:membrane associated rhomboid family serine protease
MREASVGFHCPDDVAIGRRTQRAPRNAVGAMLRESPPYVTGALLALNIAAYLATAVPSAHGLNSPEFSRLFQDWELVPFFVGHNGEYYRLITAGFLHANLLHIATNMISLVFVGPVLERLIGHWRFVAVYLISLIGGSVAVYAFGSIGYQVVGASGALFGLFGACLVLVRRLGLDLQWLVTIIVLNFVFTFSVPGISKLAHIGGFVTGALAGVAIGGWPTVRKRLSDNVQLAGLAGLLLVLVLITLVRTATGSF